MIVAVGLVDQVGGGSAQLAVLKISSYVSV